MGFSSEVDTGRVKKIVKQKTERARGVVPISVRNI